jgi:predicted house-cleaning noncanonical NTP pyrophosphatase (MazG superfamily)
MDWMHQCRIASLSTYTREIINNTREQEKIMDSIVCCELGHDYDTEVKLVRELTEVLKKINADLADLTEVVHQINEELGDEREAEEA